ncbi:MAG: FAD-binding oxidoreductase [Nitrososphaerales archaeon]
MSVQEFRAGLRGSLLSPGGDGYDSSRKIYNGMIDRHPSFIAKCAGVADIIRSVDFARENKLLVSVKGGGHNVAGNAVCDGGLMIDLSNMRSVVVDPERRTAKAEPGATWADFDTETQAFGLATTGGQVSATGIAGFTVGGGHGWLMGLYGRACDNLLSADVVTADGRFLRANATENPDLFWGIRGGGGNFGIITSFEFKLYPLKEVLAGILVHPISRGREVLRLFRDMTQNIPDELGVMAVFVTTPEGSRVSLIQPCFAGPIEEGEKLLERARRFGPPLLDLVKRMPYSEFQRFNDRYAPTYKLMYWKSGFFETLTDEAIDTIFSYAQSMLSPLSMIHLEIHHGWASRVSPKDTAFYHRGVLYNLAIYCVWKEPEEARKNLEWLNQFWEDCQSFMSKRVYVNFLNQEGDERVRASYGENYQRLVDLKNKYDPMNFFRMNQNIKPSISFHAKED